MATHYDSIRRAQLSNAELVQMCDFIIDHSFEYQGLVRAWRDVLCTTPNRLGYAAAQSLKEQYRLMKRLHDAD